MKRLVLILTLILLTSCSSNYVEINNEKIQVELAITNEEKQLGLMFREPLCENCGMLFVYEDDKKRNFWMQNTFIPLDMVFIDSNFTIVNLIKADPCFESICTVYSSGAKARFVLETNQGKFNQTLVGEKVKINT